jgi:uracil-DNA glycosylase
MPAVKKAAGAEPFVPVNPTIPRLWDAAQGCKGCDLYRNATQAVLGEGPAAARVMMVGEQPGDKEDLAGHPFVGPAGGLLDRALLDAGIDRADVYVTNAVKHFKFEERGKRRIHKKPSTTEIVACKPWLEAELSVVKPQVIVCLGATAARSVIGKEHSLMKERGKFFEHPQGASVTATVHPSSILRAPDADARHEAYAAFVRDLKAVKKRMEKAA